MANPLPFCSPLSSQPSEVVLIGRTREQAVLDDLLTQTINGHGRLVLIGGTAGIGKTALVRWLTANAASRDVLTLTGSCYDLTTTPPYGPWREVFERVAVPDSSNSDQPHKAPSLFRAMSGDIADNTVSQSMLLELVRQSLASMSAQRPLVVILEDLHWSDPISLDLLRDIGRTLHELAVLVLVTYRDDEIVPGDTLSRLLPLLIRESDAVRLHPAPLSAEHVGELISPRYPLNTVDTARLVDHVITRTDGNPFFVNEVLHGLGDERLLRQSEDGWVLGDLTQAHVSPVLRELIDSRLIRLEPQTRDALQVAAVIGSEVELDLWQTLTTLDDQELDRVIVQGLESRALEEAPGLTPHLNP